MCVLKKNNLVCVIQNISSSSYHIDIIQQIRPLCASVDILIRAYSKTETCDVFVQA
jgi:hypothetical protein